jgi:3-isopropylmalate/(R)-2-methylmalate dehydratase large subunit
MPATLLQKVWNAHAVRKLPNGQTQLFIGLHLIHEVTSPQAFDALRARGWTVARTDRTFATVDHIVPTRDRQRANAARWSSSTSTIRKPRVATSGATDR